MAIVKTSKHYRLGADFAFRGVDGVEHHLAAGTELGPQAMANFDNRTVAVHVSTGLFQEIVAPEGRRGLAGRVRSIIVRTT